jgi:hypothetical protein
VGASSLINCEVAFPGRLKLNRQQAALQQIDMAIEMFHHGKWTCAITLALAAETQMPDPEKPFVSSELRSKYGIDFMDQLNEPRNWLKHAKDQDTVELYEMDALMALLRAISSLRASMMHGRKRWQSSMSGLSQKFLWSSTNANSLILCRIGSYNRFFLRSSRLLVDFPSS